MLVKSIWLHMIVMNVTKGRTLKTLLTMVYSLSFHGGLAQTAPSPAAASTFTDHNPDSSRGATKMYINSLGVFSVQPLDFGYW